MKILKKTVIFLAAAALLISVACSAFAEEADALVLELASGAERGAGFTSVDERFESPAGSMELIMCGLKEEQKAAVLKALSEHFDGKTALKLVDAAFPDAEKYDANDINEIDSGMCWAGTTCNLLWMAGWAEKEINPQTGKPFSSEDELFAYFFSRFTNKGVDHYGGAVDWFFMGEFYNLTYSSGADLQYTEEDPGDGVRKDFVSSFLTDRYDLVEDPQKIEALLRCDWSREDACAFAASIGSLLGDELGASEHAVTVAGIITDPAAADWRERYRAILLMDTDNDGYPAEEKGGLSEEEMAAERAARPNSVSVYPLKYSEDSTGKPFWEIIGYNPVKIPGYWEEEYLPDRQALYSITPLLLQNDAYYAEYREEEGNCSVWDTVDLTLEGLFTTDQESVIEDMYMVEKDEVTVTVFKEGDAVNLNFFVANRSQLDLEPEKMEQENLTADWSVVRDSDGTVVASGKIPCKAGLYHNIEQGFMIHLNEKDGGLEAWEPGSYTVTLDLNADRAFKESYYKNNMRKEVHFEIR